MSPKEKRELKEELRRLLWMQSHLTMILNPKTCPPDVMESIERIAILEGVSNEKAARIAFKNSQNDMQRKMLAIRARLVPAQK